MTEIITYDRGETIRINNIYTDIDDDLYDPSSIELRIYTPSGTLISTVTYAATEIIKDSTGTYHYDYDIPDDAIVGWWITKWIATGSFTDVSKNQFKVADPLTKLYCTATDVWNRSGVDENVISENEVILLITSSMSEIDAMFGKQFSYGNNVIEWFDTYHSDPYKKISTVKLKYKPIISMTSVEEYDKNNDLVTTHSSDNYWINEKTGFLRLTDDEFVKQYHRVKVVYSYGYETIPEKIVTLCTLFSAMKLLIHQIGGTYDDVTSWSAAGLNISVGEPYMNMSRNIEFMQKEATRLIAAIGRLRPSAIVL